MELTEGIFCYVGYIACSYGLIFLLLLLMGRDEPRS